MTDQELKELVASLAIKSDRLDAQQTKTEALLAETSKEVRETSKEVRETSKKIRESQAKTDEQFRITEEQFRITEEQIRITEEQMRRNDEKLARMGIHLGNISNNQGDVAEEFFYNSLDDKKTLAGIKYDFVGKNWKHHMGKAKDEYDIVMVNGKDIAIVEVKYKAHERDLEKLITKKYENFKILYPTYKDYNHHLALASFHINEELREEALKKGVIVLQRKGDMVETFEPVSK